MRLATSRSVDPGIDDLVGVRKQILARHPRALVTITSTRDRKPLKQSTPGSGRNAGKAACFRRQTSMSTAPLKTGASINSPLAMLRDSGGGHKTPSWLRRAFLQ